VVLHENLPETTPEVFARELMGIASEMSIYCFSASGTSDSYELEALAWPPVSWSRVVEQILAGLPSELREKWGFSDSTGPLADELRAYCEKYRQSEVISASELAMVRRAWIPVERGSRSQPAVGAATQAPSSQASSEAWADSAYTFETRAPSRIELTVLGVSLAFAMGAWLYQPEEEMMLLAGIRFVASVVVGASFMGFFAMRALSRAVRRLQK
jgi:hypothetical protein